MPVRKRQKDGLPFYSGPERAKKLKELASSSVHRTEALDEELAKAAPHLLAAKDLAILIGEDLNEAKRINGGRTKWTKWRHKNWCKPTGKSKETAVVYARLAREKDSDEVKNAPSIEAAKDALTRRNQKRKGKLVGHLGKKKLAKLRDGILRQVNAELKELDPIELAVLAQQFQFFWPGLYEELKGEVDEDREWFEFMMESKARQGRRELQEFEEDWDKEITRAEEDPA